MSPLARGACAVSGAVAVGIAAIGAMHTAGGRMAMARLGIPCPVGNVTAAQVTQLREAGLRRVRGSAPAPARPALGMRLGRSTQADVADWQVRHAVQCDKLVRGYAYMRCRGVPAQALDVAGPPISELWFSFGTDGRLLAVDLYRRGLDDRGAVEAWSDARARLQQALGAPARVLGDASPGTLRASELQTARLEYRYSDYIARVTAANLPHAGLAVREQYALAQ